MEQKGGNRKLLVFGLIAILIVVISVVIIFYFSKRWEKKLILERTSVCEKYTEKIAKKIEGNDEIHNLILKLQDKDCIYQEVSKEISLAMTKIVESEVSKIDGLEGGVYLLRLNEFVGYAFPTSDPPIPAYGPPPRSYNIIKDQALHSIEKNSPQIDIHTFDPAVFPLATYPFSCNGEVCGAVWVRIHIERDLPVEKLKKVLNFASILFLVGFLVFAVLYLFLRIGIKNMRTELSNTREDPNYRLKQRGGLFGFIPKSINEMLDIIDYEYNQRLKLKKKLYQKEKLASLGKMIAGVAHEVKTPLSVIKTRMQIWQNEVAKDKELSDRIDTNSMAIVINEINRISGLMKRLVVFSRPIYNNLKPVHIEVLLEEVLSIIEGIIDDKSIKLEKEFQQSGFKVNVDSNSIKQILINIYNNSVESINTEGKIVTETFYEVEDGIMTIKISDDGSGIPDEVFDSIFDPFFTTKETGTGLGLAISHEIISSHGGTISFGKNDPKGTICFISLPFIK